MAKKQSIKDDFISFKDLIEQPEVKEKFKEMLGEKNGIAFLQSALQVVQKNPEMLKAESNSLLNAFSAIASLNLLVDPSFGQAFIDVYKLKDGFIWRTLAQFQIGYKGLIELGHRTNQFYIINSIDVREGEFKKIDRMTGEPFLGTALALGTPALATKAYLSPTVQNLYERMNVVDPLLNYMRAPINPMLEYAASPNLLYSAPQIPYIELRGMAQPD